MQTLHEYMSETKAMEYILAVAFLFLFIVFWRFVQKPPSRRHVPGIALLLGALFAQTPAAQAQSPLFTPTEESCAPCHARPADVVILGDLEDLYRPVAFDHKLHAEMTAMTEGCVACHHHTPEGAAHPSCRSCHERTWDAEGSGMPGLKGAYHRQCLGCHREWSHETACDACHLPRADLDLPVHVYAPAREETTARRHPPIRLEPTFVRQTSHEAGPVVTFQHGGHARAYGLSCADCHGGESCAGCHDYTTGRTVQAVMSHETCLSCHRQENCGFCHSAAERPPFDHASSVGWTLAPHHTSVGCAECHGSARDFAAPSRSCNGCHARRPGGRFDHRSNGSDVDCTTCHSDMAPTGSAEHERHPALDEGCTACHDPHATGPFRMLRRAYPGEFYAAYEPGRYELCFACHEAAMMETASGARTTAFRDGDRNLHALHVNREKGRTCRACHDVHTSDQPFLIRRATPLGNPGAWLPLEYERLIDGGRCAPGCHRPQTYLRDQRGAGSR